MSARLQRLAALLLPWLLLFGCHRETRTETQTQQVASMQTTERAAARVDVERHEGPSTTVVEEYLPLPFPLVYPEANPPAVPDSSPTSTPAPVHGPLVKRTTITVGPIDTSVHQAERRVEDVKVEVKTATKAETTKETDVGLSWQVRLALLVGALLALFLLYRFTPPGRALAALLSRLTS